MVQHLLVDGFRNIGIRALASSVGMSDRMLMYYFETKEELVTEALLSITAGFEDGLELMVPQDNLSGKQLVDTLMAAALSDQVKPVLKLWFEIVGLAMRDDEPYKTTARMLLDRWEQWIRTKLRKDQRHRAPELLGELEGRLMVSLLTQ